MLHHQTILLDASTDALLYCCAYLFSTTPCVRWPPTFPGQLAPTTLQWAEFSLPLSCSGFLTRNDVPCPCHARALGAQRRPDVSSPGFSALCFNGCLHTLVSSNPPFREGGGVLVGGGLGAGRGGGGPPDPNIHGSK